MTDNNLKIMRQIFPEYDTHELSITKSEAGLIEEVYGDRCEEVGVGYSFQKWVRS